jgi:hypothetical protein
MRRRERESKKESSKNEALEGNGYHINGCDQREEVVKHWTQKRMKR